RPAWMSDDRPVEHHALVGVGRRLRDEPPRVADALRGNERALGVEPVEDVAEPLPFFADEIFRRDLEIAEERFARLVVHHVPYGPQLETVAERLFDIDQKER